MTSTSIDIDRPADQVFAYVTDPTQFHEWQQGVVSSQGNARELARLKARVEAQSAQPS
jgi:uncharacterized protein YndB with AHSA1/START domain